MSDLVKFYSSNTLGRDFVVGDLHGCYSALLALLDHVNFRPAVDRIFSVGDIVDRGPQSENTLELLKKPWFASCMGNHEQMLLAHLSSPNQFLPHDPKWLNKICPSGVDRQIFAGKWKYILQSLPPILAVGGPSDPSRFFVVHAELLESKKTVIEKNIRDQTFSDPIKTKKRALWGRALISAFEKGSAVRRAHEKNMPLIFCGHTVLEEPTLLARQLYLDGGAYLSYDLLHKKDFSPTLRLFDVQQKICFGCNPSTLKIVEEKIHKPVTL